MCTLTFIPKPDKVIITSNRDEHVSRGITDFPVSKEIGKEHVYFPQDPKAGGTWIAASTEGRINVLLNGAFQKHKHQPPYRLSRGIILLDVFKYHSLSDFRLIYDLDQIEPFTLVQFNLREHIIEEIRWDGKMKHFTTYNFTEPHIWSSSTLYDEVTRAQRKDWFTKWLEKPELSTEDMLKFHQFGGEGDEQNSITMNRGNGLQTVSISQIYGGLGTCDFSHHNLLNNQTTTLELHK